MKIVCDKHFYIDTSGVSLGGQSFYFMIITTLELMSSAFEEKREKKKPSTTSNGVALKTCVFFRDEIVHFVACSHILKYFYCNCLCPLFSYDLWWKPTVTRSFFFLRSFNCRVWRENYFTWKFMWSFRFHSKTFSEVLNELMLFISFMRCNL